MSALLKTDRRDLSRLSAPCRTSFGILPTEIIPRRNPDVDRTEAAVGRDVSGLTGVSHLLQEPLPVLGLAVDVVPAAATIQDAGPAVPEIVCAAVTEQLVLCARAAV